MQVSSVSSSPAPTGAGRATSSSDVAKLQKQLRELTDALKQASSDQSMDGKAREQKVKLLQSQIQMVQAQIEAIQRQKQQEQLDKQREVQQADDQRGVPPASLGSGDGPAATASRRAGATPGLGESVDTYV